MENTSSEEGKWPEATFPSVIVIQGSMVKHNEGTLWAEKDMSDHFYFLPSTMMIWYPNCVLTRDDKIGLSTVDGWSAKAASWNAPYTVWSDVFQ